MRYKLPIPSLSGRNVAFGSDKHAWTRYWHFEMTPFWRNLKYLLKVIVCPWNKQVLKYVSIFIWAIEIIQADLKSPWVEIDLNLVPGLFIDPRAPKLWTLSYGPVYHQTRQNLRSLSELYAFIRYVVHPSQWSSCVIKYNKVLLIRHLPGTHTQG